jgi:hypothetical protein
MTTGTGDGLMQLLRQIADDLSEVRREERSHVSRHIAGFTNFEASMGGR